MTTADQRYRQSAEVLWRRSLDGVLLMPRNGGPPVTLSGSGIDLWQLLAEPQSLDTVARLLAERFDVDSAEVAAAIAPVLDELVEIRVVESIGS